MSPSPRPFASASCVLRRRLAAGAACAALLAGLAAAWVSAGSFHSVTGPAASLTGAPAIGGAPAEGNCTGCHQDFDNPCSPDPCNLNTPGGGVEILDLPATYLPGQTIPMRVRLWTDSTLVYPARRWGFQITAVRESDGGGVGAWVNDDTLQVELGLGDFATRQYLMHRIEGTRPGLAGPVEWSFAWTPPPGNEGRVNFYVAANAANGDDTPGAGDFVFTASAEIAPDPTPVLPVSWGGLKRRFR